LQFDSFRRDALLELRGADLRRIRLKALEKLDRYGISTNLVVTLKKGLNDAEMGKTVDFALQYACVRGVTFQPIQDAGRREGFNPATERLTLTEVRRKILEQTAVFKPEDIIPVPCHPDSLAMAYALKLDGKVVPLTSMIPPEVLINAAGNTILYEQESAVRDSLFRLFATNHSPARAPGVCATFSVVCHPYGRRPASLTKMFSASLSCNLSMPIPLTCARSKRPVCISSTPMGV
jgi:hypothetical protein